ncbi:helix-turn-helix domain-containing protein [Jannaschia seohaensis]|uniref:Helix-turn-helix n=1 Tax=Jannaschia seohaensis TaxID=475081 RepID=A0A2Y9C994_9RHOB|nr:XRE family transcriptional regulator [Jannaschia seohaensis]PWJ10049.1 helix-turn-helix protein [Jannaschia seohaensis]SSA51803.1 Helix-turn-helix [Jannaschia seohaensis]
MTENTKRATEAAAEAEPAGPRMGRRIRTRRQKERMTLQAVADVARISPGYLSLIERDKAVPTLTTLDRIARAIGTGLDELVSRPGPVDCMTRAETRPRFFLGSDLLGYERVSAQFPGAELSSYVLTAAPGYASETVMHDGEEQVFVLAGRMRLTLDGAEFDLGQGDSVHYTSERPHAWANPFPEPAQVLWTGTDDIFARRQIADV